jgi:peptidoglycan/xylan/chitin deacetylase (PgdA/CDA1 family)
MTEHFLLVTNDVETTSILNHTLRDKTAEYLLTQGMPVLLDLYEAYNVKTTFFFTGYIAQLKPALVKMAHAAGHEIASHGLRHAPDYAFDVLPLKIQIDHLHQSKRILEDICGSEVISFRAPAARANYDLPIALEEAGYKIDSSVSSQRLDMMFSFGSLKKLNWIMAPRLPYFVERSNVFKRGDSSILEVPISAFAFPYIGTFMRVCPALNRLTRMVLYMETKCNDRPITFLTHPNEYVDEDQECKTIKRRGKNVLSYLLGDIIRHKLKLRNLGAKALPLLARELAFFSKRHFSFVSCRDYYYSIQAKKNIIG